MSELQRHEIITFDKINVIFYYHRKVITNSNYFYNCILTLMRNA